jgi:hypothetical protein
MQSIYIIWEKIDTSEILDHHISPVTVLFNNDDVQYTVQQERLVYHPV